jgi:hypothetical protein
LFKGAASSFFLALLANMAATLKQDILSELKAQQQQLEDKEKIEDKIEPEAYVKNKATGVVHVLAPSSSSELPRATVCGWRFASQSTGVLLPGSTKMWADACVYKLLCEKCLPYEWALRKRELSVA